MRRKLLLAAVLLAPAVVLAQSSPGFTPNQTLTASQLNSAFVSKQDALSFTGTGNTVRATSPTLVTPALGTPSALVLTNATGLPLGGMANLAANAIIGNNTGSPATPVALTAAQVRTLLGLAAVATSGSATDLTAGTLPAARLPAFGSGDVSFATAGGAGTIATNAVTNAKAAQMAAHTIKGNNTAGTANAADLTVTEATAELNAFVGDSGSGGTKGLVPAPASGDAAANKVLGAGGTWVTQSGGGGSGCVPSGAATNLLTDDGAGACTSNAGAKYASGTLTLGTAGSLVGSVGLHNATSGTITLSPATGALGAVTATLPINTGTIAELNLAQTWSAAQSFNSGDLKLNGATSGAITLNAASTAGANTITLPAGTTDFSATGGTSQVLKQTTTGGAFTVARLACSDLSDSAASCATDATNASNLSSGTVAAARGGAGTITGALKGNGAGVVSQAACADLSNAAASCATDATNASNISSGTLAAARGGAGTVNGILKADGAGTVSQAVSGTDYVPPTDTNAQTGTSYTVLTGDNTKLVTFSNTSAVAVTLPQAGSAGFGAKWGAGFVNLNTGVVTITTTTSTINGSGQTVVLPQGASAFLTSDGTNWMGAIVPIKIPGTSGGIPYYAATNQLGSSAALTANAIVLGGGAGAAPAPLGSLGTTTTVLHGNAGGAPTFGAVSLANDVTGSLALSSVATQAANTVVANVTGSTAAPTAASLPSCIDTGGNHLNYTNGSGFSCGTSGGGGGGIGTKIATCTLASTTCNFNSLGSHDYYELRCSGVTVSTTADVEIQVNSDSTSGHYDDAVRYNSSSSTTPGGVGHTSGAAIIIAGGLATTDTTNFVVRFSNITSTTFNKIFYFDGAQFTSTNVNYNGSGAFLQSGTAITSVQLLTSAGTFGSGANKCSLYAYDS